MRKFNELLESQSNAVECSIAIRGYGRFAGPVVQFLGQPELGRLLAKLFSISERFFTE